MENKNNDNSKMIKCKECGKEIAASAKACPHCGAPNKKPVYKRVWFWVLIVLFVLGFIGALTEDPTEEVQSSTTQVIQQEAKETNTAPKETEAPITYIKVSADDLIDELHENALKAEKTYQDAYVEVSGRLANIDSDGKYISITAKNKEFCLDSILCDIQNDEQLNKVMEMKKNDIVTIRGKIKDIGEIMGYSIDIDEII